jgi:uncharacterized membrane protein
MTAPTWCDARAVLQAKCVRCHSAPPAHGAPFSLLSYADTQELDHSGKPRFEKMRAALDTELMPPTFLQLEPPVEQLTTDEKTTLLAWLAGDPPTDADGCE